MQVRAIRLSLLALLVLTGLTTGYFTWDTHRRINDGIDREHDVERRIDRLTASVEVLASAQQGYVAPGQQRGEWLSRATIAIQQLYDEAAALRSRTRAPESAEKLRAFAETIDAAVKADDRTRENLRSGQDLMAADIVYSEARQTIDAMSAQVLDLQDAERAAAGSERQALESRAAKLMASGALIWIAGLFILTATPRSRVEPMPVVETKPVEVAPEAVTVGAEPQLDLAAAADVCSDLSRLVDGAALPAVLDRAARVLDARGLIVWLGAGDQLFVAASQGYASSMVSRLGAIHRTADNATADCWRSGAVRTVSGDEFVNGAVVAPLTGPSGCFGVLAAELRHGRESDVGTRALAAILAAQLSSILAAGPAPSLADETPAAGPETGADVPTPHDERPEAHRAATA